MFKLKIIFISLCLSACAHLETTPQLNAEPSLWRAYKPYFRIGAAIDPQSVQTHAAILTKHFNSMTTENEMKWELLQPNPDQFDYAPADNLINFAQSHKMAVRGHALVWHRQTPAWVFKDNNGGKVTPEELKRRMKHHITQVMQHFGNKISAWDVVNEAIMDDGKLRTDQEEKDDQKSPWYGVLGESYIADAFIYAHDANPRAKLYYNDYYNYVPARRAAIYQLLKKLRDQGVPVYGVGLQAHLNIHPSTDPKHQSFHQTIENLEQAIQLYASLGLDVQITELDVSVYIGGIKYTPQTFYTPLTFNAEIQAQQAQRFRELFAMFRRNHKLISSVSTWGVADDNTWLSEFPSGRKDFPLLFGIDHKPKPAFFAILDFLQER
ncbi:MAG: hypothetical protein RL497_1188 [Pseudomonadota bacterium]|jgi:endo-1,4-beta-xylanase